MKRWIPWILAIVVLAVVVVVVVLVIPKSDKDEKVLNILTWAEYIDGTSVLEPFTAETGIKINYDYADSNDQMLTKLKELDGGTYDIVLASDYTLDIIRREGLMLPLDKEKIPNWGNIGEGYRGQFFDPDDEYVIPYIAGTPLIVYDPARVDIEITGYASLWDESLRDSLVLMDDARNIIGITLKTLGYSFNETDPEILQQASDKLMELKPNVSVLNYDRPDLPLVSGDAYVGYLFTPAVIWALEERPELEVVYPEEGMGFGIDALFIPVNAPHPDNAHAFLDFMLRPEIGAAIAEKQDYMCVNLASLELLPEDLRNNPAIYIPEDILGKPEYIQDVGEAETIYTEIWTKFKQY